MIFILNDLFYLHEGATSQINTNSSANNELHKLNSYLKYLKSMIWTDTNIWYHLKNDPIVFKEIKLLNIYPNFINLFEIGASPRIKDSNSYIELIKKITPLLYNSQIIPPLELFLNRNYGYAPKLDFQKELLLAFFRLNENEPFYWDQFITSNKTNINDAVVRSKEPFKIASDVINTSIDKIRKSLIDKNQKRKHRIRRHGDVKGEMDLIETTCINNFNIQIERTDLFEMELFFAVFNKYLTELETGELNEFQPNSWNDLFVLMYVKPGDLYWTKEKYWPKKIKELGLEKYLFEANDLLI